MTISNNILKWIRLGIEAALILVIVSLSIAVGVKNKSIRVLKEQVRTECAYADSIQKKCDQYAGMDGISVSTTFVINNKNIMSLTSNAVSNVTRNYAVMTKQEVLNALDSLQRVNNEK